MPRLRTLTMLLAVVAAAWAAGPKKGEECPPLHIDAVNDQDRGEYEIVEDAADRPCLVFIIAQQAEGLNKLILSLDRDVYKVFHEPSDLQAAIVVALPGDFRAQVVKGCEDNNLTIPAAVAAHDAEELKAWGITEETKNLLVFVKHGQVDTVMENVKEGDGDAFRRNLQQLLRG